MYGRVSLMTRQLIVEEASLIFNEELSGWTSWESDGAPSVDEFVLAISALQRLAQAVLELAVYLLHNTLQDAPSWFNFDMLAGERCRRTIPILRTNVQPRWPATATPAATRPTSKRS